MESRFLLWAENLLTEIAVKKTGKSSILLESYVDDMDAFKCEFYDIAEKKYFYIEITRAEFTRFNLERL